MSDKKEVKWNLLSEGRYAQHPPSKLEYRLFDPEDPDELKEMTELKNGARSDLIITGSIQTEGKKSLLAGVRLEEKKSIIPPPGIYAYSNGGMRDPEHLVEFSIRKELYIPAAEAHRKISNDLAIFLDSKKIYEDLGVLHKRGYLLYGPGGTGKTQFIRNFINSEIPKDSYTVFMEEDTPSTNFMKGLDSLPGTKFIIMEEIAAEKNHSMASLLNFLDGEGSINNCVIFATTNYPDLLAQNLTDRPSRFDMTIEVGEMSEEDNKKLYEGFLKRPLLKDEINLTGMTAAYIKEICLLHLTRGWSLHSAYAYVKQSRIKAKNGMVERGSFGI